MASIRELLYLGERELFIGEIDSRSGDEYAVNLKNRIVNVKSSITETLSIGDQVFVTDIDNELRIIQKADVKSREEKEVVIVNG